MNEAERQIAIEKELRGFEANTARLPDLVEEPSIFNEWAEKLAKWLEELFPSNDWDEAQFSAEALWVFFQYLGIALLVVIVLIVIYLIYRNVQGLRPVRVEETVTGREKIVHAEDAWANAIKSGEWGKAMRLRWSIFIGRSPYPRSMTMLEYASVGDNVTAEKALDYTRGMFRPGDANEPLHDELHNQLSQVEKVGGS